MSCHVRTRYTVGVEFGTKTFHESVTVDAAEVAGYLSPIGRTLPLRAET